MKIENAPISFHVGTVIHPSAQVHKLSILLDNELTTLSHVSSIVHRCFYYLRQLRSIRSPLTDSEATTFVLAFIFSRINYCNLVLFGVSAVISQQLQCVLNSFACLITSHRRFDHIIPALRDELH